MHDVTTRIDINYIQSGGAPSTEAILKANPDDRIQLREENFRELPDRLRFNIRFDQRGINAVLLSIFFVRTNHPPTITFFLLFRPSIFLYTPIDLPPSFRRYIRSI